MTEWWRDPEWGKQHPMHFPAPRLSPAVVVVLPAKKKHGSKEQAADERVRILAPRR